MQFQHLPYTRLRITSPFGPRNTGIPGASRYHKGVDIGTDKSKPYTATDGGPVTAVLPGTVTSNYYNNARGWVVLLDHGLIDGRRVHTLYQHLKQAGSAKGTRVKAGDRIGTMGNTGVGAQLHLHFELHIDGTCVNPALYLNNVKEMKPDMTKEEVKAIALEVVKEALAGQNTKPSSWAEKELALAVANGITDGSRPGGYCTREQAAIMVQRALRG